jgi:pimeloyl-ACP methyl ester carboxylesterase
LNAHRGPTWVLLHGTPLDPAVWDAVGLRLQGFGSVLVPDAAPHRDDAAPQANIAARLASQLGDGPADLHVVGHSFGGQVALELGVAVPDRLRTLTIVCSRITPFPPFAALAESVRRGDPVEVDAGLARWFTASEIARDGPVVDYARRCLTHVNRAIWSVALDAIASYDGSGQAPRVHAPTTSIAAQHDGVSTPWAMAYTAQLFPHGHFEVVPGAMHMSPFMNPDELTQRLLDAAARKA